MLEVYNENLQDLLTSKETKENLDIKMQGKKLVVKGLTEVEVTCEDDITRVMETGDSNRSVAATKMNSTRFVEQDLSFLVSTVKDRIHCLLFCVCNALQAVGMCDNIPLQII